MRNVRLVLSVCVAIAGAGCGGEPASGEPGASTSGGEALASVEIPEGAWERTDIAEGALSLELPGSASRRVVTNGEGQTFQYVVAREPMAVVVAVEPFDAVIAPSDEQSGLDNVAALFGTRAREPQRQCTPGPVTSITHQDRPGRTFSAANCGALGGGTMATVAFLQGSVLVAIVVVGDGVAEDSVAAVMQRVRQSIQFGERPSWFRAVDTEVTTPVVPGLAFRMPSQPTLETIEEEGATTARFVSEPIRGMAMLGIVSTPARLALAEYCRGLEQGRTLELTERRTGMVPGAELSFCEVRGRRQASPETFEIHEIFLVPGGVLELIWVGPNDTRFIKGGEAQLEAARASIRTR